VTRPVCVRAWLLAEGDVLPGGQRVMSVQRDPAADRVVVATDDGKRRMLYRDDQLVVACIASHTGVRYGGMGAFLGGARDR
jgi:hypothetical protein